jgi:hypothetical protein
MATCTRRCYRARSRPSGYSHWFQRKRACWSGTTANGGHRRTTTSVGGSTTRRAARADVREARVRRPGPPARHHGGRLSRPRPILGCAGAVCASTASCVATYAWRPGWRCGASSLPRITSSSSIRTVCLRRRAVCTSGRRGSSGLWTKVRLAYCVPRAQRPRCYAAWRRSRTHRRRGSARRRSARSRRGRSAVRAHGARGHPEGTSAIQPSPSATSSSMHASANDRDTTWLRR